MRTILNRLKEPSTWAGLSVLASLVGVNPTTYNIVTGAVAAVAAAIAVLVPEGKNE